MSLAHDLLRRVDLNLLPVLAVLLETRSVTESARRLGLTQSATSRALGRLRDVLDDELLVRHGQRMMVTPRAESLQGPVRRVLADTRRLFEAPAPFDPAAAHHTVRIAGADYVYQVLLPPLVAAIRAEAPGVDVQVLPRVLDAFGRIDDDLDGVVFVDGELTDPELVRTPLFTDTFVTLLRTGHPALDRLDPVTYAALDHVLVAPGGKPGGLMDRVLAEHDLERRVAVQLPSFGAAVALVERTDLVVTLPERLARLVARGRSVTLLPTPLEAPGFRLVLYWPGHRRAEPAHRWLRRRFVDVSGRLDGPEARLDVT